MLKFSDKTSDDGEGKYTCPLVAVQYALICIMLFYSSAFHSIGYKLAVSWLQPKGGGIGRHMQYVQIVD